MSFSGVRHPMRGGPDERRLASIEVGEGELEPRRERRRAGASRERLTEADQPSFGRQHESVHPKFGILPFRVIASAGPHVSIGWRRWCRSRFRGERR